MAYEFTRCTGDTLVYTGIGKIGYVSIAPTTATPTAGLLTIYDNTAASGTKIGTITLGAALLTDPPQTVNYEVAFGTGLTIVTSAAEDLTVIYAGI